MEENIRKPPDLLFDVYDKKVVMVEILLNRINFKR